LRGFGYEFDGYVLEVGFPIRPGEQTRGVHVAHWEFSHSSVGGFMISAACEIELKADIPRLTAFNTPRAEILLQGSSERRLRPLRAAADLLIQPSWQLAHGV
jgi:hypothetical protein